MWDNTLPKNRFLRFCVLMAHRCGRHNVAMQSAALAFYLLFMIFPFLIFISALLGLLDLNITGMMTVLSDFLPEEVGVLLRMYFTYVTDNPSPQLMVFGLVFSIYFPMRATNTLMRSVRIAYHLGPPRGALSQLVKTLRELENNGCISAGKQILVIPTINAYSVNISRRFFGVKEADINRSFPGNDYGEPADRLTNALLTEIKDYVYGIQFTSFYRPGEFVPHVRMMETGYQNTSLANLFGLPYVVVRNPVPLDTKTLNYNWQIWKTRWCLR